MKPDTSIFRSLGIVLFILGIVVVWKMLNKKSNLDKHMQIEGDLGNVSIISNSTSQAALDDYPLTTIGDTPFAGVHLDYFMPDSEANRSRPIEWMQSIFNSTRPTPSLGESLKNPNTVSTEQWEAEKARRAAGIN